MDGLSGAASVAGIVSLTVQLAESIQKICKFLSTLKHASEDIEDIIDDLDVLTYVLADIQRCEELFGPQPATAKALLRCRRQVQALGNMVTGWKEDLEKDSRWRRGQAAFKVVIKADKVKEWRGKIGEAKETLSLALQASSSRVQHTQLIAIAKVDAQMAVLNGRTSHIQTLVGTSSVSSSCCSALAQPAAIPASDVSSASTSYTPATEPTAAFSRKIRSRKAQFYYDDACVNRWTNSLLGTVQYQSRRRHGATSEEESELVNILFQPSWWLQKLGFNTLFGAQLQRSSWSGWQMSLWAEHLVPDELFSRAESVIENGNLQGLIDMLSSGVIGIHSKRADGNSLLEEAAFHAQPDICAFLLKSGADPQARNHESAAVPFHFISISSLDYEQSRQPETMKVFTAAGQDLLDIDMSMTLNMLSYPGLLTGSASTYCWLLDQLASALEFCDEPTVAESWAKVLGGAPDAGSRPIDFLRHAFTFIGKPKHKRLGLLQRMEEEISKEEAELWMTEVGSLHFTEHTEEFGRVGPLSLHSMTAPTRLNNLRRFLDLAEISVGEFVKGDIPLVNEACTGEQDPWTEETLLDLFHWDFEGIFVLKPGHCFVCDEYIGRGLEGEDNAVWTLGIQQIKHGRSPEGPFEGEEEKAYRRWTRYMGRWRSERICKDCQDEEGMIGSESEPEDGDGNFKSSPFLLDI